MRLRIRNRAAMVAVFTLAACGGIGASGPPAHYSPTLYEGACPLVGIEETPAPVGPPDDSIALVLRYRFGERAPWDLASQLARSDARDTQFELQGHETTLCTPNPVVTAAPTGHTGS
jgi:hypothetical protein